MAQGAGDFIKPGTQVEIGKVTVSYGAKDVAVKVDIGERVEPLTFKMAEKFGELLAIFDAKQKDYGKGNISEFGRTGILIRMNDKFARIKNMVIDKGQFKWLKASQAAENEPLRDSYMDIAVYAVIDWLIEEGIWDATSS